MEEKRIIELIEFIIKNERDDVVRESTLFGNQFTGNELNLCVRDGLIGYDNPNYFLLSNGINFLNQYSISKNTKKLLDKQTPKWINIIMLILTLIILGVSVFALLHTYNII